MNIRTLLNRSRFAGCKNPRAQECAEHFSLYAAECRGGVCLMEESAGVSRALAEADLPEHVLGRVRFWNAWCSSGFNGEAEIAPSLFGLEAYAVSIGVDVLRHRAACSVDWCGLPLHDDAPLLQAMRESRSGLSRRSQARAMHCPPWEVELNRYAARLMRGDCPAELPQDCFVPRYLWDWGMEELYLVPRDGGCSDEEPIPVDAADRCLPQWLTEAHEQLVHLKYEEYFWDDAYYRTPQELWWHVSPLMYPLQLAALSVDWARVLRPLRPVSLNNLYITGPDVLDLCRTLPA